METLQPETRARTVAHELLAAEVKVRLGAHRCLHVETIDLGGERSSSPDLEAARGRSRTTQEPHGVGLRRALRLGETSLLPNRGAGRRSARGAREAHEPLLARKPAV